MKTLTEFANEIMANRSNPRGLADLHIEMASKYATLADMFKDVQIEKAQFWQQKFVGEKPMSDTALEHKWIGTEGGTKELRMKLELKSLEKLMSAIKTSSVVNSVEAKNSY